MKPKKPILIIVMIFSSLLTGLNAQEAILTSGGDASGNGGTVSYTIGQIAYYTWIATNGSEAQGVQQPWEISTLVSIKEAENIDLKYIVYPNPASSKIILQTEESDFDELSYMLYDMNGQLLKKVKITSVITVLDLKDYASSFYFLSVIRDHEPLKKFKIIKVDH